KTFAAGYMAVLETPYDAQLSTERRDGSISFTPVWLSSKERFGYNRKLRYAFFDKGGYVAQCKKYRSYIWPKNGVLSLKQNSAKLPAIDKMVGGMHIYVWDNARNAAFAKELKDSGISKAMFLWNPNHTPYPSKGYDDSVAALGFVPGVYELPTDTKPRDSIWYDLAQTATPFKRNAFPGLYNQIVARKKDGAPYVNQFGHFINPAAVRPHIFDRFNREMAVWPHQSYFVDVYQANGLYECWSKENPLTREGWAAAIRANQQYLIDSLHQFLGAEWGADFCNGQTVYAHGMMTGHRTWWGTEIGDKGTIYYTGDWRNGARPTQMLGIRTAPPKYLQYSINEALRVPLYELVYHDAVVTSWRWEDANHHAPEIWWKKDLFNALYGNAPLWNLDRETWSAFCNTFIKSYKTIHPWLQQIGYDEMVSHRFVTLDKKVQESVFSSGKKVVANFGDGDVTLENKRIPARGFITF
ncbi:MAG TPA: glycoside hydrolase, partial [Flavisolibacter sp.]|nr:glycoside hydrolase [Flavisolibacter sp.]